MQAAGTYGERGFNGKSYPAITIGAAIPGALVILEAARTGRRSPAAAWFLVTGGFALAAFLVVVHGGLSLPG